MWPGFDGVHSYTPAEFAAYVDTVMFGGWVKGITLHNTAAPRVDQWAETGPNHDARIRNLQSYYETQLGWHAGPHLFISRSHINGFSDLTKPGVHSRCFNATHIGIEMVGDYNVEAFDTGDGAMVRDTAVFALATLYKRLGLSPDDLVFHKECLVDNHDCPGKNVIKGEVISRVKAAMSIVVTTTTTTTTPQQPTIDAIKQLQGALNACGATPRLDVDGWRGPKTDAAYVELGKRIGVLK